MTKPEICEAISTKMEIKPVVFKKSVLSPNGFWYRKTEWIKTGVETWSLCAKGDWLAVNFFESIESNARLRRSFPACRLEYLPSEQLWQCWYDWTMIEYVAEDKDEHEAVVIAACEMLHINFSAGDK